MVGWLVGWLVNCLYNGAVAPRRLFECLFFGAIGWVRAAYQGWLPFRSREFVRRFGVEELGHLGTMSLLFGLLSLWARHEHCLPVCALLATPQPPGT